MKYFAKLGLNSKVIGMTHIADEHAPTEKAGIEYLQKDTTYPFWVQGSKDGSIRKNAATTGYTYDEDRDAFISPQKFSSWTLNEDTCRWEAPVAYPEDGIYKWNESTTSWDPIS
jgi:hypothetical protein